MIPILIFYCVIFIITFVLLGLFSYLSKKFSENLYSTTMLSIFWPLTLLIGIIAIALLLNKGEIKITRDMIYD